MSQAPHKTDGEYLHCYPRHTPYSLDPGLTHHRERVYRLQKGCVGQLLKERVYSKYDNIRVVLT